MILGPIENQITDSRRVLIAGAGGGYDVLGAVPLAMRLEQRGLEVFLANLSFTNLVRLDADRSATHPVLFEVSRRAARSDMYCPEAWLAAWYHERHGVDRLVAALFKTGVKQLSAAYAHLVERHDIDTIVLLDGGIDLILRGDESSLGTPAEDLASLTAVAQLDVRTKIAACVGFGVELRDGIRHAQVLRRIADLTGAGAYYGSTALVSGQPEGDAYLDALEYVFAGQAAQRKSHVHRMIRDSMRGEFGGEQGPDIWVSPLMNVYWYFSLDAVFGAHLFAEHLQFTTDITEVAYTIEAWRKDVAIHDSEDIPI